MASSVILLLLALILVSSDAGYALGKKEAKQKTINVERNFEDIASFDSRDQEAEDERTRTKREDPGCVRVYGGSAKDGCCSFPFVYEDKSYEECQPGDGGKTWCGTTYEYEKWGYCDPTTPLRKKDIVPGPDLGRTKWGRWHGWTICPPQRKIIGFRTKVENWRWWRDNTALNGVQFKCEGGLTTDEIQYPRGKWSQWKICESGHVTQFDVRAMGSRGWWGDDVGATNVRMRCSDGGEWVGDGLNNKGAWVGYARCPPGTFMCGGRGLVEGDASVSDDTAINRIQMACCKRDISSCASGYFKDSSGICKKKGHVFQSELRVLDTFTTDLTNRTSTHFRTLAGDVRAALLPPLKKDGVVDIDVYGFRPGSVIAEYNIVTDPDVPVVPASQLKADIVDVISSGNITSMKVDKSFVPVVQEVTTTTSPTTTTVPATRASEVVTTSGATAGLPTTSLSSETAEPLATTESVAPTASTRTTVVTPDKDCTSNNGGCSQRCSNLEGSPVCACNDGFNLLPDGKSCTPFEIITEGPVPHMRVNRRRCASITKEECMAVAESQGIPLLMIINPNFNRFPPGCYHKKRTNVMYFNGNASSRSCTGRRRCLCKLDK